MCVFSLSHKWPECDPEMTCACQEQRVCEWYLLYGTLLPHFTVGRDNISQADKQIDPPTFGWHLLILHAPERTFSLKSSTQTTISTMFVLRWGQFSSPVKRNQTTLILDYRPQPSFPFFNDTPLPLLAF